MYIKVVAFVLCVSGFLTGALVALYSFSHPFPYSGLLGVWETCVTLIYAIATWLISYDLRGVSEDKDEE